MNRLAGSVFRAAVVALLAWSCAAVSRGDEAKAPAPLATGVIVDPVACEGFPGQSYALYLPSTYRPERRWPVIYVYDPRERGALGAELHRAAAERFGWIVVASNNTRSDERENDPNPAAIRATWDDSHRRYAIDERRVYVSGFSGGARAAAILGLTLPPGGIAGVIGHGGGFPIGPRGPRAERAPSFDYYGLAGRRDFNVSEMTQLEEDLAGFAAHRHFEFFDGIHQWAPEEEIGRALAWMELRARVNGLVVDRALVPELLAEFRRWAGLETVAGDRGATPPSVAPSVETLRRLDMLVREFAPLLPEPELAQLRATADTWRASQALRDEEREAREILDAERKRLATATRILHEMLAAGPAAAAAIARSADDDASTSPSTAPMSPFAGDVRTAAARLELGRLQRDAEHHASALRRDSAARVLSTLSSQTGFYMPREYAARGDHARERQLYELSVLIAPKNSTNWLRLATCRAASGSARDAMAALRQASALRQFDRREATADKAFDGLRGRRDFQEWVAQEQTPR
jgi:predicted esterase